MGRGEFEEIFDECLSALLEGRRTIEESLSLYPAWRGRLEPLLRAAEETAAAYDQPPPPYARERGLQRFLEAARTRRRLRQLLPSRPSAPWWSWAPLGAAAVLVIGALAFLTATLVSDGGEALTDEPAAVSVYPYDPPTAPVEESAVEETTLGRVHDQLAQLEEAVRSGRAVDTALLWDIENASNDLATEIDTAKEIELVERVAAVSAALREYELLQALQVDPQGFSPLALEASLAATGDVLGKLGATPEPSPEPTPIPTPSPEPTARPSPAAVEPTAAPSPSQ